MSALVGAEPPVQGLLLLDAINFKSVQTRHDGDNMQRHDGEPEKPTLKNPTPKWKNLGQSAHFLQNGRMLTAKQTLPNAVNI
jgi:hypothetical protein